MAAPHSNAADETPRLAHQAYGSIITSLIKRTQLGLRKSGDEGLGVPRPQAINHRRHAEVAKELRTLSIFVRKPT
jgi:hypothetical protein